MAQDRLGTKYIAAADNICQIVERFIHYQIITKSSPNHHQPIIIAIDLHARVLDIKASHPLDPRPEHQVRHPHLSLMMILILILIFILMVTLSPDKKVFPF